jgi:hypothetical protein
MIVNEQMARRTRPVDTKGRSAAFRDIAKGLGVGLAAREKIEISELGLG